MKRTSIYAPKITDESLVKTSIFIRMVALATLLFIIPLEALLRQSLTDVGISLLLDLQKGRTDGAKYFFEFFYYLGTD